MSLNHIRRFIYSVVQPISMSKSTSSYKKLEKNYLLPIGASDNQIIYKIHEIQYLVHS